MAKKVTLQQIWDYNHTASEFFKRSRDNEKTKVGYAIKKIANGIGKAMKKYNELVDEQNAKIEDIRIDLCEADDKGVPLYDVLNDNGKEVKSLRFNKTNTKKLNQEVRKIKKEFEDKIDKLMDIEAEIEPYYVAQVPADLLTEFEIEAFTGFIIKPANDKVTANGSSKEEAKVDSGE